MREEPPLKEKGLDFRLRRPVTVQEFFEEFVSDRAPLGVDKYHGACMACCARFVCCKWSARADWLAE